MEDESGVKELRRREDEGGPGELERVGGVETPLTTA